MGCGDRSVTVIKQYQTTNQSRSRKLFAKSPIQPQTKGKPRCWSTCRMWTTSPQTHTLLKVSLSCTSLKTLEQWSKWSLRAEVRQWDMFPEATELLLIGCLIESIWTPRSISYTLTPETNSHTDQGQFHTWWLESLASFVEHHSRQN